jgi:hypothetical protein
MSEVRANYINTIKYAAKHLAAMTGTTGYLSASSSYKFYRPHWIRDSSWVAISLIRYAKFARHTDSPGAGSAMDAATRIISFNIGTLKHYMLGLKAAATAGPPNKDFFLLKNHLPARVGMDYGLYKDKNLNDLKENDTPYSWLMQHDSVPLVLLALREKSDNFGLNQTEKELLTENGKDLVAYLGKIYLTACANAWEQYPRKLHAYDLGVIYAAFNALEDFASKGLIDMPKHKVHKICNGAYIGGPAQFLKDYFLIDKVIQGSLLLPEKKPDVSFGVDSATIFLFSNFGIKRSGVINSPIERATIAHMEKQLLGNNALAIRYIGDTYFMGGRWLLLGLAFADYYAQSGNLPKARGIIDYVINKYHGSYPEQEIVNPTSPGIDRGNYYKNNGNKTIQNLEWSYAALIIAVISLITAGG